MARVRVRLDRSALQRVVHDAADRAAANGAEAALRYARQELVQAGRVNTGNLLASLVKVKVEDTGWRVRYLVGSPLEYAIYQEKGVGPIKPMTAQVLRFKPKGSSSFVFAHSTKGFEGAHYMQKAVNRVKLRDFLRD